MSTKVYFCVSFNDQKQAEDIAKKVQELSSCSVDKIQVKPPKLMISAEDYGEEEFLIYPEVLLVEGEEAELEGKLVLKGSVVGSTKMFKIEIN